MPGESLAALPGPVCSPSGAGSRRPEHNPWDFGNTRSCSGACTTIWRPRNKRRGHPLAPKVLYLAVDVDMLEQPIKPLFDQRMTWSTCCHDPARRAASLPAAGQPSVTCRRGITARGRSGLPLPPRQDGPLAFGPGWRGSCEVKGTV